MAMRQIVLDTETTGLKPSDGHRIIEIGCVEMIDRRITHRSYHQYINPERDVEKGAFEVHGISEVFLADKPTFAEICNEFLEFVQGAELIIHNAPFDIGFLDSELRRLGKRPGKIDKYCTIFDTLVLARQRYPGQKNNLDALCKRLHVDNSIREMHGGLLDAKILAQVYLLMTGGQGSLFDSETPVSTTAPAAPKEKSNKQRQYNLTVALPTSDEASAHEEYLQKLKKVSDAEISWE
jgi:DNA polymerase-3 subunit epsilon